MIQNYLSSRNQTTLSALSVANMLQDWLTGHADGSVTPQVTLEVSEWVLSICVGDSTVSVWNSEENQVDELAFDFCRDAYIKSLASLGAFVEMAAKQFADDCTKSQQ